MRTFFYACGALFFLTLSATAWQGNRLIHDLRISVRLSDSVLANANDAAFQTATVARSVSDISQAETKRLVAMTQETQKTEASARLLIVRTNESLNGSSNVKGLLPAITSSLGNIDAATAAAAKEFADTNASLAPGIANFTRATSAAADSLSDPAIKSTLAHLDETSASVSAMALDGKQVADKARETYLKPVNIWWALMKQLISSGGSFAQMVK